MSRAYRITVKESLTRDLKASDEVCSDLEILAILPADQMAELMRGELRQRGFEEDGGKMIRHDEGITVSVDPNTGEVSVKAEAADSVELKAQRDDWGYDDAGPNAAAIRSRASEQLKQDLERRADQQQTRLQTQATEKLEGRLDEVRKEWARSSIA